MKGTAKNMMLPIVKRIPETTLRIDFHRVGNVRTHPVITIKILPITKKTLPKTNNSKWMYRSDCFWDAVIGASEFAYYKHCLRKSALDGIRTHA